MATDDVSLHGGRRDELREAIARTLFEQGNFVGNTTRRELADALLDGPLAPLLAGPREQDPISKAIIDQAQREIDELRAALEVSDSWRDKNSERAMELAAARDALAAQRNAALARLDDPALIERATEAMTGWPLDSTSDEDAESWRANTRAVLGVVRVALTAPDGAGT